MAHAITLADEERWELTQRASGGTENAADARRARLILLLADGHTWDQACEQLECSRTFVANWRRRFAQQRIAGLRSRRSARSASAATASREARILEATRRSQADASGWWSTRSLGAHLGFSHMTVARVWRKHGVRAPHASRRVT